MIDRQCPQALYIIKFKPFFCSDSPAMFCFGKLRPTQVPGTRILLLERLELI